MLHSNFKLALKWLLCILGTVVLFTILVIWYYSQDESEINPLLLEKYALAVAKKECSKAGELEGCIYDRFMQAASEYLFKRCRKVNENRLDFPMMNLNQKSQPTLYLLHHPLAWQWYDCNQLFDYLPLVFVPQPYSVVMFDTGYERNKEILDGCDTIVVGRKGGQFQHVSQEIEKRIRGGRSVAAFPEEPGIFGSAYTARKFRNGLFHIAMRLHIPIVCVVADPTPVYAGHRFFIKSGMDYNICFSRPRYPSEFASVTECRNAIHSNMQLQLNNFRDMAKTNSA